MSFIEVNNELNALVSELGDLSMALEDKRTEYDLAKHAYELTYSGFIITGKIENPNMTQTDLKNYAIRQSSEAKAKVIYAFGAYRKLRAELNAKRQKMDAVMEKSRNLRQELKTLS